MSKKIGMYKCSPRSGDEPAIIGSGIDATWALAWPNVIARVWYEEFTNTKSDWYLDLFSLDPKRVMRALKAEGFIIDSNASSLDYDKWVNLNIVVKRREEGIKIIKSDTEDEKVLNYDPHPEGTYEYKNNEYDTSNGWQDVQRIEHNLILTIPPMPKKAEEFSVAIADYQAAGKVYPFTFFIC